jgi:hypothetical protein
VTRQAQGILATVALTGLSGFGVAIFSVVGATANPFSGQFSGGGTAIETSADLVATMLGEDISAETMVLAGTGDASDDTLTLLSGRIRMVPSTVNANALFYFDASGFKLDNQVNVAAGAAILVDYVVPRQNSIPLSLGDSDGSVFALQASPGTCDAAHKGAVVGVSESATSATRLCRCIRTSSSGDYRWLNMDNATRGTTTTDCPDTTP